MQQVPYLHFDKVTKTFGDLDVVAPTFDLEIRKKEFVVFLGPSGCGKTTLMRMVGGLDHPTTGSIWLEGLEIVEPDLRRSMVFQSYSSFPWLTVRDNVAFGMRYRRDLTADQKRKRCDRYLELVGLSDFAAAFPARISGGMRQRVAIARALAAGSEILLMDEPFGALDAQRREQLQIELRRIQREDAKTIVFVTHDVEEAVFLADRIVVFSSRPARIVKILDIAGEVGGDRTLAYRESEAFFHRKTEVSRLLRTTLGAVA
jgi:NitT/TauT family transport system ATP-binding protein